MTRVPTICLLLRLMVAVVAIHLVGKNVDSDVIVGLPPNLVFIPARNMITFLFPPTGQLVFAVAVPGQGRPWGKSRSSGLATTLQRSHITEFCFVFNVTHLLYPHNSMFKRCG